MRRYLALALVAFALAGCGSSDETPLGAPPHYRIPGCEAFDTAPCDIRAASCQERLMQIAACLRQEAPAPLPPVSVMTEAEVADLFRQQAATQEPSPHRREFETAFGMFGLVAPGAFETDAMVNSTLQFIDGFYRWEQNDIVIVDHGEGTEAESASDVLVHEFVHVLQDREVDLATWGNDYPGTFDARLALKAVVEGEARFHEIRYRAPMLGIDPRRVDWQRTFQNRVDAAEKWVQGQASPLIAASDALPYEWGARLAAFAWDQTGHAGVTERFANPPATTHAWMASIEGVVLDEFTPRTLEPPAADGWTLIGSDVLGAAGVFLSVSEHGPPHDARAAALAWRGDLFAVYQSAPDTTGAATNVAVWSVDFADEGSAHDVGERFSALAQLSVGVAGSRLTLAASDRSTDLSWALPPAPE